MRLGIFAKAAAAAALLAAPGALSAQSAEEFYAGKTVSLYIGYSVGGGYDTYGRLVAAHIGKHLPGNPTVVPINMPGAGSLKLANWLYDAAPKDGTAFGTVARGVAFEPLLENEAAKFDAAEFNWIGNANAETSLCGVMSSTGIDSIDQIKEREVIMGGTGAGSDPVAQADALNAALGTKIKVIDGYPGGNDVTLAMERGELEGRCGWSWSTIKTGSLDWVKDGKVNLLVQIAPRKHPDLPDVPLALDLAQDDEGKALVRFVAAPNAMGRPYVAPPGVPEDRVEALRAAFDATMQDPEFLKAAGDAGLGIEASTGDELREIVAEVYATDPETVKKLIEVLR